MNGTVVSRSNFWAAGVALVVASLAGPAVAEGQELTLPADIQVDLYLLRADRQIQSQDYAGALESLDIVLTLQANAGMETSVELLYRHAQVALDAGYPQAAVASLVRYLRETGREGDQYAEALALLDEAQTRAEQAEARSGTEAGEAPGGVGVAGPPEPEPAAPGTPATPASPPVAESNGGGGGLTLLFPMVGVNAANMSFTSSGPESITASQLTGAAGGLGIAFPVGGPFGVQFGAHWAQKGARVKAGGGDAAANADLSFQSFDFTALARISPPEAAGLPVYLLAGPYVSFELDCRVALDARAGTERFSASDDCAGANLATRSMDFGVSGGLAIEGGAGVTIGLLYSHGLRDIDKYAGETAKHRVFNVYAGIARTF